MSEPPGEAPAGSEAGPPGGPGEARTIRVEVTLKGSLATWLPGGRASLDLPEGTSAEGVLAALGVPQVHCICVVNGAAVPRDTPLREQDRLLVYPPMAGGSRRRHPGPA